MMAGMKVDPVLERYGPPPTTPIPAWLTDARRTLTTATDACIGLDERELNRRWWWREDRGGETEVRYAFYRSIEALERAAATASDTVVGARPAGAAAFGPATAARWDLHGVLAPLVDADLDADPGGGEWTRSGRRSRTSCTCSAPNRPSPRGGCRASKTPDLPAEHPGRRRRGLPEEESEGTGSLAEIRTRLDGAMDGAAERMARPRRGPAGDAGALGGLCRRCRLPARPHVLAPAGAHGPGRQDARSCSIGRLRRRIGCVRLVFARYGRLEVGRLRVAAGHGRCGPRSAWTMRSRRPRTPSATFGCRLGHGLRALNFVNAAGTLRAP